MIKQEIKDDRLDKDSDYKGEENPYQNIIINEFDRNDINASQIEQWSILSNVVNPYHAEGYSQLVPNYAKHDYSCNRSKCSTMPSVTIVA